MADNAIRRDRVWTDAFEHVSLRALVPLNTDPGSFGRIVWDLAKDADACESKISGKDDF